MNSVYITDPTEYLDPRIQDHGFGSIAPVTVIDLFKSTVAARGNLPALHLKRAQKGIIPQVWTIFTWNDYWSLCKCFAKSILHLGINRFKIVNILGFNSPEWFISNTGSMLAGCIAAGIYATNLKEACLYITNHSRAELVIVDGNQQLKKYIQSGSLLPHLKGLVVWGEDIDPKIATLCDVPVYDWEGFLQLGSKISDQALDVRSSSVLPGHCALVIYTSGTTGEPKAVMLSHDNITWTTNNVVENVIDIGPSDRFISYLPLSHIAAQLIDIYGPMARGVKVYFAQPDVFKGSLVTTLRDVRPTVFVGVPRVWEKIQEKMLEIGRRSRGLKKYIVSWAKNIGTQRSKNSQFGKGSHKPFGYSIAKRIVFRNIRKAIGLDQCLNCFGAAAPMSLDTLQYFASIDIHIYEIFGQSECTGPHSMSLNGFWRMGFCGRPLQGTETKFQPGTGELCYRGRHIFMGYMYNPQSTAETIDDEGYLHSGDVGEMDDNLSPIIPPPSGFLRITGRIKELIITAGGENIPPVLIENEMKAALLAVSNVMVIGDKRKFLSMVVALKCEVNPETGEPTDKLAADALYVGHLIGSAAKTMSEAAVDPFWKAYIDAGVKKANSKTTSNAQVIQKWKMLPADFSEKHGDLTPTLKLKRDIINKKYADLIDSIYREDI